MRTRNPLENAVFPEFYANRVTFRVARPWVLIADAVDSLPILAGYSAHSQKTKIFYCASRRILAHLSALADVSRHPATSPFSTQSHAIDLRKIAPNLSFVLLNESIKRTPFDSICGQDNPLNRAGFFRAMVTRNGLPPT